MTIHQEELEMKTPMISRRHLMMAAAALPLTAGFARTARAAAQMMGGSTPIRLIPSC